MCNENRQTAALAISLFVLLGVYLTPQCWAQSVTITGHVKDSLGQNMQGMTVFVMPYGVSFYGPLVSTVTDKNGAFELTSAYSGRLQVIAYKDAFGYPDVTGTLFTSGNEHFPVFDLQSGQERHEVEIILPPADGVISGIVRDARTGIIIPQARITLRWAEKPDVMYSSNLESNGSFLFALPPRPVTVEVTAEGYRPWHYVDVASGKPYASLVSGTRVNVSINLAAGP